MTQFVYAIVRSDGTVTILDDHHADKDLATLLKEEWKPMREAPMGGGSGEAACSLVVLTKGRSYD